MFLAKSIGGNSGDVFLFGGTQTRDNLFTRLLLVGRIERREVNGKVSKNLFLIIF